MERTKPLSKHEIDERALWIACNLFWMMDFEIHEGEGPASVQRIRRFLRNRARRELLLEREGADSMNEMNLTAPAESAAAVKERTPGMIGAEIRMYIDAGRRITLLCGIEIGRRLVEAKEMLSHGEWLPWLKEETDFSERTAQNYMKVFNAYGAAQLGLFGPETNAKTFADLPVSKALALLTIPESEREDFAAEVGAGNLSVRELEEKVRERTDELRAAKEAAEAETRGACAARDEAEKARADAEEQLRRIKAEIDEIEKRPQPVAYERDEEAIAQAAKEAADAEREKHKKAEAELREQIAALTGQVKSETGSREKLEKQLREAEEKAEAAQKAGAGAEELRGQVDALKKQLALAAPEAIKSN